jgi:hypothetical protein
VTTRYFTSWVRRGAAAGILEVDPLAGPYAGPATFKPRVVLARDGAGQPPLAGPEIALLGPGAVERIDARQVARIDPAVGATAVEDNFLALIELARPDLPWLFTPASPAGGTRLRPWIVLVVVEAASVELEPGDPLPRITVSDSQLPDLNDSWAWAHAQATVDGGAEDVDAAASTLNAASGSGATARLLCPRRLKPDTAYLACLVPATHAGVQSGLGLPQDPGPALAMAWTAGAGQDVVLPVYYSWTFATGQDGDFKSLVLRLRGVPPNSIAGFGTRTIDMSAPWTSPPQLGDGLTVELDGALAIAANMPSTLPVDATAAFETRISALLDFPADRQPAGPKVDPSLSAVAPPIYAGRHAGQDRVPTSDGWLRTLNLDPRRRIAAAFGTRYVQDHQEFLMARAWDQVGAVREANRLRALADLACETANRLHARHVMTMGASERVALAAPARSRVVMNAGATLRATTAVTAVPAGADTVAYSRLSRPLGPLGRRAFDRQSPQTISKGLAMALQLAGPATQLDGLAGAPVSGPVAGQLTSDAVGRMARRAWQGLLASEQALPPPGNITPIRNALKVGAQGPSPFLQGVPILLEAFQPPAAANPPSLADTLASALLPGSRIIRRLGGRLRIPPHLGDGQSAEPVMACPHFTAPLALALLREHPEYLVPGLGKFPDDRVTLLVANGAFVEAFMAGANHEMNRELLWRGYPTDQRGTPFQRFWPRPDGNPDIPPITAWPPGTALGANGAAAGVDLETMVVLLVRGEILRRYPRTIAYAAPGKIDGDHLALDTAADWLSPLFLLPLDAKTTAFAYALGPGDVHSNIPAGNAGRYFVFSEPVTGPRFNFDVPGQGPAQRWTDLDWDSVPTSRGFAIAGADLAPPPLEGGADSPRWNTDAADTARIAFARPFRIAYHADELLAGADGG